MTTKRVTIAGEAVELASDMDLDGAFTGHEGFSVFMPSFSVLQNGEDCPSQLVHEDIAGIAYRVLSDSHAVLSAPAQRIDAQVLAYAAYPLTEYRRQKRGAVTAHAAAVAFDSAAALILGKEGAGKSTVAIQSCKDLGARLVGNDLTIVENTEAEGIRVSHGTKILHLRRESARRGLSELLSLFPPETATQDPWLQKVAIRPDKIGIEVQDEPTEVKVSAIVHVDESQEKIFVREETDNLVSRLVMYENFSRYIRGSCLPGLDKDRRFLYCLPSLDTPELFEKRTGLIERILNQPLLYVSGRSKDIATFLRQEVKHHA